MPTKKMLCPTALSLSALFSLTILHVSSKVHLEWTVHPPSPLIKTFKPYNGSECEINKSVYHLAYGLGILTTTVYEIINNHLGMKNISTRWGPTLLTSIQRTSRLDCCQELLQGNEANPDNYFHRIVTGHET